MGIEVLEPETYFEGKCVGRFKLDRTLSNTLEQVGLPANEVVGLLSPLALVTVPQVARQPNGIPADGYRYAFSYPLSIAEEKLEECATEIGLHNACHHFLLVGGFIYFNEQDEIVQMNALSLTPSRMSLEFDGPNMCPEEAVSSMRAAGRLCKVTLDTLESKGMTSVGWVHAEEALPGFTPTDMRNCANGAFVYTLRDGGAVYFHMAPKPPTSRDIIEHSPFERLVRAALIGQHEVQRVLQRDGIDIDAVAVDREGQDRGLTALMWASREGLPDAVKALLRSGANSSARRSSQRTVENAITLALSNENVETVRAICAEHNSQWLLQLDPGHLGLAESFTVRRGLITVVAELASEQTNYAARQVARASNAFGVSRTLLTCMRVVKQTNSAYAPGVSSPPRRPSPRVAPPCHGKGQRCIARGCCSHGTHRMDKGKAGAWRG